LTELAPDTSEDALKAISAAAAAAGGVEHWHGIGRTPEAPDFISAISDPGQYRVEIITLTTLPQRAGN
jgi:predicted aconitase